MEASVTTIYITLRSGEVLAIIYSFSFGEIALVVISLAVLSIQMLKFLYEVTQHLWWRRA
jgi:hypothetical protein